MKSILTVFVMAASVLALVVGCSTAHKEKAPDPASLVGTWELTRLAGLAVEKSSQAPFIQFGANNTVAGSTGVNRFNGKTDPAQLSLGGIKLDQLATTRRAGEPAMMELESKFLRAMAGATRWRVKGSELVLSNESGEQLAFRRTEER